MSVPEELYGRKGDMLAASVLTPIVMAIIYGLYGFVARGASSNFYLYTYVPVLGGIAAGGRACGVLLVRPVADLRRDQLEKSVATSWLLAERAEPKLALVHPHEAFVEGRVRPRGSRDRCLAICERRRRVLWCDSGAGAPKVPEHAGVLRSVYGALCVVASLRTGTCPIYDYNIRARQRRSAG
jgi:hypothetical protein